MIAIIYANLDKVDEDQLEKVRSILKNLGIEHAIVLSTHDEIYPIRIEQIQSPTPKAVNP